MPEVSIIIPLFNKEPHIARTLNSVINQTFKDFEVVVVDDGSTDDGAEIVKEFKDSRIRLIQQENAGVSVARNRGVKEAITDFIAFLDADDEWMPLHLETLLKLKTKYPEAGLYSTAYKICTSDQKIQWADYREIPPVPWEGLLPNYFKSAALGEIPVNASVVGIPKKIFHEVGGFSIGYWYGEDEDLWGKIALKYPVAFSWELGAIYYKDAINRACVKGAPIDYVEPFVKNARNAIEKGEVSPEYIVPLNEYIYKKEIWRAAQNVLTGNGKTARTILSQCKTKWHFKIKTIWFIMSILPYRLAVLLRQQKRKVAR